MRNLLLFATMSLIWGLTWAATRFGLDVLPPLLLAALRYLLTAVLLIAAARGARAAFEDGYAFRTVASALLVNTGTYGLLFWGMQTVSSGLSALVNLSLIPVLLFTFAAATGEERPTWRHALALLIGCAGLVALFWTRLSQADASGAGLAAIVGGTVCYCLGSVVARPLLARVPPLPLTFTQAAIGGTALLVLSLAIEQMPADLSRALSTPQAIGSLTALSLFGTIVAYTIYLKLLGDWGTMRAGLYAFVSPIVALAAGAWLFGESIGGIEIGGMLLLLGAAAFTMWPSREKHA